MIRVMLFSACSVLNARFGGADRAVSAVSTDSRNIPAEALFVAWSVNVLMRTICLSSGNWWAVALLVQRELEARVFTTGCCRYQTGL